MPPRNRNTKNAGTTPLHQETFDEPPKPDQQPGMLEGHPTVPADKTERQMLVQRLREYTVQQYENMIAQRHRPAVTKSETLVEHIQNDPTNVGILRAANASYVREITKYDVEFKQGPNA